MNRIFAQYVKESFFPQPGQKKPAALNAGKSCTKEKNMDFCQAA